MTRTIQIIIGLLVVIAIGLFAFGGNDTDIPTQPSATSTTQNSQDENNTPSDWESYENARLDVSLQYPPSGSVQTEGPQNKHIKVTYLGEDNATGEITDGFTLTVSAYKKDSDTNLRAFVDTQIEETAPPVSASEVSSTTFRGQTAFSYTTESLGTIEHLAFAPSSDRAVTISSNISDPNDNNYQQLVDQIIASLDFTAISGNDTESAANVSEVTLTMLNRDVPENEEPQRGCDMLAPITVDIEPTEAPLTAAMEKLFSYNRTEVRGLHNFIANTKDTLSFDRATVKDGTASIYLNGELSGLAGVCDNPRAAIQIEETARRFSTVETVQLYLNGEPTDLTPSGSGQ